MPLEGAPSARLWEKEPQQVLDPVDCLPVHLVTKHLHVKENTSLNIVMGDGLGRRIVNHDQIIKHLFSIPTSNFGSWSSRSASKRSLSIMSSISLLASSWRSPGVHVQVKWKQLKEKQILQHCSTLFSFLPFARNYTNEENSYKTFACCTGSGRSKFDTLNTFLCMLIGSAV